MKEEFIFNFEYKNLSMVFLEPVLVPILNERMLKTYVRISDYDGTVAIDDVITVVYSLTIEDKIYSNAFINAIKEYEIHRFKDNKFIYIILDVNKLTSDVKNVYRNILCYTNEGLRSYYSLIDDDIKIKILRYHQNILNTNKTEHLLQIKQLYKHLYPQDYLHELAEILSYNNVNDSIKYQIEKIGEYGTVINIDYETLWLPIDEVDVIQEKLNNNKKLLINDELL